MQERRTPEYRSTAEVADRLKVTVATVNRWVAEKRLTPAFTAPGPKGARFFEPDDVEALAVERRAELTAAMPDTPVETAAAS